MHVSEPAEYAILGLLEARPMHGYEMFQHFQGGTLGQIVHLEMSQMYAFLKKLERLNYIAAELEPQGSRPPRKVFHLTSAGRDYFRHWLTEPVERPRDIRILFLLKLYFIRHVLPEEMPALIERQIAACQAFLRHLEELQRGQEQRAPAQDLTFFDRVVLRSRIHQTRALIAWLQELQHDCSLVGTSS
uniref:PadR family transcriptional regulator n=1 Tax=Thermogemmatispora argillosa TaxID=2045280 RepID=A0A455T6D9_9CHLR|nr:PadR family transcriptional regulator [Thermogemmatispora argillosa]